MKVREFKNIWLILFFSMVSSLACFAQHDKTAIIENANAQYAQGFFDHALALYLEVSKSGYESPELYYNIGNTCFKLNRFPQAILNYEKALKLSPGDEDIRFNLQIANTRTTDRIETLPDLFYMRWWKSLISLLPANQWASLGIIFVFAIFAFVSIYFLSKQRTVRRVVFYLTMLLLVITSISLVMAYGSYKNLTNRNEAIIFEPSVAIKSAPADGSTDLFLIHEGTKVIITDRVGEWREVRIVSGSKGWVKAEVLEII
ncbi:MAG: tetratricopeptide repeat protein [Bacteroidales bacterium]|nr:tetratricopeptide repeat protein [Bacteroidales bacterium]MDZ4203687.1 tetratricopeptide repeat protein [Bacteroidales bacterium]